MTGSAREEIGGISFHFAGQPKPGKARDAEDPYPAVVGAALARQERPVQRAGAARLVRAHRQYLQASAYSDLSGSSHIHFFLAEGFADHEQYNGLEANDVALNWRFTDSLALACVTLGEELRGMRTSSTTG